MLQLAYFSVATVPLTTHCLNDIARLSSRNNARDIIGGKLLAGGGRFCQILEGDAIAVENAFDRIAHDTRHRAVQKVFAREVDSRAFHDWDLEIATLDGLKSSTLLDEFLQSARNCMPRDIFIEITAQARLS